MQDWLSARAYASPDKIAIIEHRNGQAFEMKYDHLNWQVDQLCVMLSHEGVSSGQHIAMLMSNSIESVTYLFASMRIGLIFVPLNTRLTVDELDFQLTQADVDYLLTPVVDETVSALQDRGHAVLEINPANYLIDTTFTLYDNIDLDKSFLIVHTSGTSGKPKGATLTYGNLFYSAMASAYRIGHNPDDRWLCVLPLFHIGGISIFIRAVLYGITVDLYEKFDTDTINYALTHEDVSLISLVPTMLYRLLESRTETWNSKLRLVLLGGAATTPELMQGCIEEDIPVATTYGLSEASSQVATTLPGDAVRKPGTVGKPLMFTQVKIVDENGISQNPGDYGEVLVKGETIMQGYYNNPDATEKTIREGWLHTGDIGYLDTEGDLFLVQRRSDLIITGGENVYPAEIESVLRQHPAIKEVAVVGIPDTEWGQKVAVAIILENKHSLSIDELSTYAREHLAGYKIPREMVFVDALPLTGSGKIERNAVRNFFTGD